MLRTAKKVKSRRPVTRGRRQRGAGLVESALVILTTVGMIVFIMDMGRLLLTEQFITERARITLRTAVVNNWDASSVANYVVYNSTTATQVAGAYPPGYLGLLPSQVSFKSLGTSGTPDYRLQIKVSGVPMFTWVPLMAGQYTAPPVVVTMPAQSLGATN
jgi:hypothetical protein